MEEEATWWERLLKLNPALVRGFIVTVFGLIVTVLKIEVLEGTVDTIAGFVLALLGLLAAVFIKPSVTPNAKVVVRDDTPLDQIPDLQPGDSKIAPQFMHDVEKAAKASGRAA